jgi:hypothetical protein
MSKFLCVLAAIIAASMLLLPTASLAMPKVGAEAAVAA